MVAPKGLIGPMHTAMDVIAKDVGDLDQFVSSELGYPNVDEMHSAFMGIQTDAIAAAIYQMKRGKAIIVGDQTGRGKGRIAAAMIEHGLTREDIGDRLLVDSGRDMPICTAVLAKDGAKIMAPVGKFQTSFPVSAFMQRIVPSPDANQT